MSYKPVTPYPTRIVLDVTPGIPGHYDGQQTFTCSAMVEFDNQEGKDRSENGELCFIRRKRRGPGPKSTVRSYRAELLFVLARFLSGMALEQLELDKRADTGEMGP